MTNLWFVLVTLLSLEKPADGHLPGDVMFSSIVAANNTQSACIAAGRALQEYLTEQAEGRVAVAVSCIELPAVVAKFQDFVEVN